MLHFVDRDKMADYNNGKTPEPIQQHEKVAEYYSIPSINLAKEVNDRILNGEFSWRDDFKDLHPSPFGQKIYFRTIEHFFESSWKKPTGNKIQARPLPAKTLDQFSYIKGHFERIDKAEPGGGWKLIKNWKPEDNIAVREGFVNDRVLEARKPDASLKLSFKGKAIGLFVTSGPDAGILEFSIDGSEFKSVDQFTQWSSQLHLPWLIMLDDELKDGKHTLVLKMAAEKNPGSKGNVCRIHQFAVNN
jgi:sialidase-1